jgi:hypothetical protein
MPLRAELNGETLVSFKLLPDEWENLKKSDQRQDITIPCCGERAVVKTSSLGTQFFAHYRKSPDCISGPESKEHLRLKFIIASAAESVGWDVTTEFIGESKSGNKWIADVYCIRGNAKVALEIQLSQQTEQELELRHRRYAESGVREAWFMKSNVFKNSGDSSKKELPRFEISNFERDDALPTMVDYDLSVAEFVKKLLSGGLVWQEVKDQTLIYYMKSKCWKCNKGLHIPIGLGSTECSNFDKFLMTVPHCSSFYEGLLKNPGNTRLEDLGLTVIGPKPYLKGNAPGFPFCVKCTRCYAPQSNYHTLEGYHQWANQNGRESHYVVHTRYHHNGRYELKGKENR